MGSTTDWEAWHADYADPTSMLSERLRVVQGHIDRWLDSTAPAPVTIVSSCAGDGRDLLDVLHRRPDSARVRATLIESDPGNADRARQRTGGLDVLVKRADAGTTDAYVDAVPADLVLLCGIFGNISDADVEGTVNAAPSFCRPNALVLWTRHRKEPDLTPRIRGWFAAAGFAEEDFTTPEHGIWSVGAHRYTGPPAPLVPGRRLFTFVR